MSRFIHSSDPGFAAFQAQQWSSPPIDGVGYVPSAVMLQKSDEELRSVIDALEKERYNVNGWRNAGNRWRTLLGLDSTRNKVVLDYGCGCGVEALQFAKNENRVYVADIADNNVALAQRVLRLYGHPSVGVVVGTNALPGNGIMRLRSRVDVFYCNGVLHHIPNAHEVLKCANQLCSPDGEVRLMVYSDNAWTKSTESPLPPVEEDVETNPKFQTFVGTFDAVGAYADWYSADKMRHRFGEFLDLVSFDYICSDNVYAVAILKPKR